MNDIIGVILSFAGVIVYLALFYWLGKEVGRTKLEDDLVQSGHAEYYLDADNEKQWRMKK